MGDSPMARVYGFYKNLVLPLALSEVKVWACLRIILRSQTLLSIGSLVRMYMTKSPGVTADRSHLSFDTTSLSQSCNDKKNKFIVRRVRKLVCKKRKV